MRLKHLLPLLITPLCCMGETPHTPARDYKMIDVQNELTYKFIDIGTTSFTISVEWSGKLDIPGDKWLFLFGKLDLRDVWSFASGIEVDPTLGKAIAEIPYTWLPWPNFEPERKKFEQQAFFCVSAPPPDDEGWDPKTRDDWEDSPAEDESSGGIPAVESGGGSQPSGQADTTGATAGDRRYLWLYVAIALALCGVFYFVRKKTSH